MDEKMNNWPKHYPETCPPSDAVKPTGNTYRFTNRCNPKQKDFQSYYELKPEEKSLGKSCNARGLSVFTSSKDCIAAAAIVPALRKKQICVANLPDNSGVLADTPSKNTNNHKTLWSHLSSLELSYLFEPASATGVVSV
jgi:hypothetical protein